MNASGVFYDDRYSIDRFWVLKEGGYLYLFSHFGTAKVGISINEVEPYILTANNPISIRCPNRAYDAIRSIYQSLKVNPVYVNDPTKLGYIPLHNHMFPAINIVDRPEGIDLYETLAQIREDDYTIDCNPRHTVFKHMTFRKIWNSVSSFDFVVSYDYKSDVNLLVTDSGFMKFTHIPVKDNGMYSETITKLDIIDMNAKLSRIMKFLGMNDNDIIPVMPTNHNSNRLL